MGDRMENHIKPLHVNSHHSSTMSCESVGVEKFLFSEVKVETRTKGE